MELINSKYAKCYIDEAFDKTKQWLKCDKFTWTSDNGDWHTVPYAQIFFQTKKPLSKFNYDKKYESVAWKAPLTRVKYEFVVSKKEAKDKKQSQIDLTIGKVYNTWLTNIFNVCKAKSKFYVVNTKKHTQDFPVEYIFKNATNYKHLETCSENVYSIRFNPTNMDELKDIALLLSFLTLDDSRDLVFAGCVYKKKADGMMFLMRFRKGAKENHEDIVDKYFKSSRLSNINNWLVLAPATV